MPDHHPIPSGDDHLSAFSATRSPEPDESYADGVGGDVGRYVRENSFITWAWCLVHLTTSRLRVFLPQSQGGFFPFKGFPVSPWGQKGIARGGERRETSSTLLREGPFELTRSTFGHCPNNDLTPPRTQRHSGAGPGNLRKFAKLPFWR